MTLRVWLAATRPKTLAAAAVPVAVGTLLAVSPHAIAWAPALVALVGAMLLQIGCNFANELGDYWRGADTPERLGPTRAVAAGLVTPGHMMTATTAIFIAAGLIGVLLAGMVGGWILFIGALSVIAALAYTLGPYPLAYRGLGEIFVFIFFGLIATLGAAAVQLMPRFATWRGLIEALGVVQNTLASAGLAEPDTGWERGHGALPWLATASAIGLQSTILITINNLRDISTDAPAGKRTLAVRLGEGGTRALLVVMTLAAVGMWMTAAWLPFHPNAHSVGLEQPGWAPAVVAACGGVAVMTMALRWRGQALNRALAVAGAVLLFTGIAACASLWR